MLFLLTRIWILVALISICELIRLLKYVAIHTHTHTQNHQVYIDCISRFNRFHSLML